MARTSEALLTLTPALSRKRGRTAKRIDEGPAKQEGEGLSLRLRATMAIVGVTAALSWALAAEAQAPPSPASPQPDVAGLKDGLAVRYYFNRFTHIAELEDWMRADDGMAGTPLPALDYDMGIGNVLTSTASDLVGAHITGFIDLARTGAYTFQITSNDGVRLSIGGVVLHEDPEIHPDTASPPLAMQVSEAGWYPLEILYYEKKGTAALKLAWQPPGSAGFEPVPASALTHQPAE